MQVDQRRSLRPVAQTARRVLREMDEDDIPNRLSAVAKSSAKVLPPPLDKALFAYLIANATFRGRVLDRWIDDGTDDDLGTRFLKDPESVQSDLESIAAKVGDERRTEMDQTAAETVVGLEAELLEAKRRIADLRSELDQLSVSTRKADKRARAGLESAVAAARTEAREADEVADALRARISDLESQHAEIETAARKRADRIAKKMPDVQHRQGGTDSSPLGIAVELDELERRLRPFRRSQVTTAEEPERQRSSIPAGVAPDTPEAIEALLDSNVRFIIDGYNVAAAAKIDQFSESEGRDRVMEIAHRLLRVCSGSVLVVFDAKDVDGRTAYTSPLGVAVVFSSGEVADDTIVRQACDHDGTPVVVSNDRELRERAAVCRSIVVWSDALIAWFRGQ